MWLLVKTSAQGSRFSHCLFLRRLRNRSRIKTFVIEVHKIVTCYYYDTKIKYRMDSQLKSAPKSTQPLTIGGNLVPAAQGLRTAVPELLRACSAAARLNGGGIVVGRAPGQRLMVVANMSFRRNASCLAAALPQHLDGMGQAHGGETDHPPRRG